MLVSSFRFVLLSLALLVSAPALAQTTLFEVSKGDKQIFVGGTIHLLKPSEFPLPEAFDQAYGKASHIYFETDLEAARSVRSEEHTSELQSRGHLVCRLLLEKKNTTRNDECVDR